VAELVDALDSKSSSARSAGSIPARGTRLKISTYGIGLISDFQEHFRGALKNTQKFAAAVRFVGISVGIVGTNVHGEFRYSERGN
jgi:hypothetical protein